MKEIKDTTTKLELVENKFKDVSKIKELTEVLETAKTLCNMKYRVFYMVNEVGETIEIKKTFDIIYNDSLLGNQRIAQYDKRNILSEDEEDRYYLVIGICDIIGVCFKFKNKIYMVERNELAIKNKEFIEKLKEQLREEEKLEIETTVIDTVDLCRKEAGVEVRWGI